MTTDLFDPSVWEAAWRNDPAAMGTKMKKAGIDAAHGFDKKAKVFNEQSFNDEGKRRTSRIINWLSGQEVTFAGSTILDIGAASGVFTVPFAERGAKVTSLEPSDPLSALLRENTQPFHGQVEIVHERFEDLDLDAKGWRGEFDLVFASMCPAILDWESVEKAISCARQFCYISLGAGGREHSLIREILPLVMDQEIKTENSDMGYLLQLLYLKGYSFESLVTRESKTNTVSIEMAMQEISEGLKMHQLSPDDYMKNTIETYLRKTYTDGTVPIQQGGRYGKVLVRIQDQRMYHN